jgi:hypothetical protein
MSRLCYVSYNTAYFTDRPLTGDGKCWGDDWDDAPYEHNAGTPYHAVERVIYSDGWFDEPKDGHYNSPFSVEDINSGRTPWLWNPMKKDAIYAGATVEEFKDYIRRNGGTIWIEES